MSKSNEAENVRRAVIRSLKDHIGHSVDIHTISHEVNTEAQIDKRGGVFDYQIRYALSVLEKRGMVEFVYHSRGWFKWYTYKLTQEGQK